jgi:hypothetical protein
MLLAAAGCTAIDNFGKFTLGDGGSSSGCTPDCDCIHANTNLNVPEHCYVQPANGITCSSKGNMPTTHLGSGTLPDKPGPEIEGALLLVVSSVYVPDPRCVVGMLPLDEQVMPLAGWT